MTSTANFLERLDTLRRLMAEADHILVGAGSGLSTAAGLDYAGEAFQQEFRPWIERYGITDLYTSSFYPFATEEERWAYWAKHIWFCRYRPGATPLYRQLHEKLMPYSTKLFIITTNVDAQFALAGFDPKRIFAAQGDYAFFQPASGSPKTLMDNREWVTLALKEIDNCRIPSKLIPFMPDGQPASTNLRVDGTFVEDYHWHRMSKRYGDFVRNAAQGRLLLLEFGVGFNTPGIIRLPFEQMASQFPGATLVRLNRDNPEPALPDLQRYISFTEEIASVLASL